MTKEERQGLLLIGAMFAVVIFLIGAFLCFYAVFSVVNEPAERPAKERKE